MKVDAKTFEVFFAACGDFEHSARELDKIIIAKFPDINRQLFAGMSITMIGYGYFEYKNYKKQIEPWPSIAIAPQKNYLSLYLMAVKDGKYVAEAHSENIGKASIGKSCIRFKKLEDLNVTELDKALEETYEWYQAQTKTSL
jgi:hypothetical protein